MNDPHFGDTELLQLAHLLIVGAGAARDIAILRLADQGAICDLAARAERMAGDIEEIVASAKRRRAQVG